MTPDEIAALHVRIDSLAARLSRMETLLYLAIGAACGSGVITLSQVVG